MLKRHGHGHGSLFDIDKSANLVCLSSILRSSFSHVFQLHTTPTPYFLVYDRTMVSERAIVTNSPALEQCLIRRLGPTFTSSNFILGSGTPGRIDTLLRGLLPPQSAHSPQIEAHEEALRYRAAILSCLKDDPQFLRLLPVVFPLPPFFRSGPQTEDLVTTLAFYARMLVRAYPGYSERGKSASSQLLTFSRD